LRLLAESNKNWETAGEVSRLSGLYDSEEYGAGAFVVHAAGSASTQLGLDVSYRDYPNYREPGTGSPIKDAWWTRLSLKHRDRISDDKVVTLNGWVGWRQYTDALVVNLNGQGGGPGSYGGSQVDIPGTVDLGLAWRLDPEWALDLGVGSDFTWSDQNLLDINAAPVQPVPGVDNELAWRVDLGLLWQGQRWQSHLGYEVLQRFTSHPIQDPDAAYTLGEQTDMEHGLTWSLSRALTPSLRAELNASMRWVMSNQEYSPQSPASYRYQNVTLGLEYGYTGKP
jgi:hypothetical protein